MSSSGCNEKVNLRVYLVSVDAKYGVANNMFKLSCPFEIFWNNQWGCVWYQQKCASFWFKNIYLILPWDPYFLSYSNLKWSRDFLDTIYKVLFLSFAYILFIILILFLQLCTCTLLCV